jgi:hypothetical protein
MDKLHIGNEMLQLDRKNRSFFDELTPEEQKKFSPFIMIRWSSTVEGSSELQAYYLISANERINRHYFDINTTQHKKFQWLLATTVSPGMGKQYHKWLAAGKRENNSKVFKFLREAYPEYKDDEIELLIKINTRDEIKDLARAYGWDEKRIKAEL